MDSLKTDLHLWVGEQTVWIIGIIAVFVFRRFIESAVSGFLVFVGNDYNADDIVYLDGRPGRIVRVGMWKTTFFLYNVKNNPYTGEAYVTGGSKLVIQNSSIDDLQIEKPLENVDLGRYHKEGQRVERRNGHNGSEDKR